MRSCLGPIHAACAAPSVAWVPSPLLLTVLIPALRAVRQLALSLIPMPLDQVEAVQDVLSRKHSSVVIAGMALDAFHQLVLIISVDLGIAMFAGHAQGHYLASLISNMKRSSNGRSVRRVKTRPLTTFSDSDRLPVVTAVTREQSCHGGDHCGRARYQEYPPSSLASVLHQYARICRSGRLLAAARRC